MILGVTLVDTGTLFGVLGPFLLGFAALLGVLMGKARWKDAAESNEALARARAQAIAERDAELAECRVSIAGLETAVAEKDAVINRELARVEHLEEMQKVYGGPQVLEAVVKMTAEQSGRYEHAMAQVGTLFERLFLKLDEIDHKAEKRLAVHERDAAERHRQTITAFEQLLAHLNGARA